MKLEIYDNELPEKLCELSVGEHCLGRGSQLQCWDDKIPEKAISIVITLDTITMSLIAPNVECWYRLKQSTKLVQLQENARIEINHEDCFSLNSQEKWYKIVLVASDVSDEQIVLTCSRIKKEPIDASGSGTASTACNPKSFRDRDEQIVLTCSRIKTEPIDASGSGTAITACNRKSFRDRCWYMDKCYRRNEKHKAKYSHMGDADFDTDSEDDRPVCQYGRQCYRRNASHRHGFKHSRATGRAVHSTTRPMKRKTQAKPTLRVKQKKLSPGEDSETELDEPADPCQTDGDSDEDYVQSDSEHDDNNQPATV